MKLKKPKFWDYSGMSLWSIVLFPLSILFLIFSSIINLYKKQKKFSIPIICVGNIYVGGTGKTPLASEIFKIIKSTGKNPGFIKKSYDYLVDEIKMLEKIGKIYSDKKREKAINALISSKHDVAILDDGYQDFSIKKDFSILCFNSKQLIGNGLVIPSGPLREKLKSISRADCIFINGKKNLDFEKIIYKINPNLKIFYSKYIIKDLNKMTNKNIIAFAGIGNPSNFFDQLKEQNVNLIKTYSFPDHHNYKREELENIVEESKKNHALVVTTEKDFLRLSEESKLICEYVKVDLEIDNKKDFINLLKSKI